MTQRKEFISYFFKKASGYRYAMLKYIYPSIDALPESSDLDILITRQEKNSFLEIIRNGPGIEKVQLQSKSYVTFVSVFFMDGTYLEIDLIHRFDRKGIIYLDAAELLNHAKTNSEGIMVTTLPYTFEYVILFCLINGASVPEKYQQYFATLSFEQRAEIFAHMCSKYPLHINTLDDLYNPGRRHGKKVIGHIKNLPGNSGIKRLLHRVRYLSDFFSDLSHNHGTTITFSGVDGAGKSTILEKVRVTLQKKYRQRTIVLRHRPSLLPILSSIRYGKKEAEARTTSNLPRQGKNENVISSLIRFCYYYMDYLLGQFYVYFRYTLRGYTVLYDRYYFDFIIDAKRSNIKLPRFVMKWFYCFIFKPKVNIFLTAPEEVILSRKQELSSNDIKSLNKDYQDLFEEFGRAHRGQRYMIINNINLDETMRLVMKQCISPTPTL